MRVCQLQLWKARGRIVPTYCKLSIPRHPLQPIPSSSWRRQYDSPKRRTLNNYTVQKSKNNATIRRISTLRTWNNSSETEINWPIRTNDLLLLQSNSAMQINRNVFARTRAALCHAKWIVISIFSLEGLPHMRKPGPPCAAIDWHCFLFSSWTIEILLSKVSTNKIINFKNLIALTLNIYILIYIIISTLQMANED